MCVCVRVCACVCVLVLFQSAARPTGRMEEDPARLPSHLRESHLRHRQIDIHAIRQTDRQTPGRQKEMQVERQEVVILLIL